MSKATPHNLATVLRNQAEKLALTKSASSSTGAPSTADGVAQVTKATVPTDPGEAELKVTLPTDGTSLEDASAMETNELNPTGTPAADKGAPAELPKMASAKVNAIRDALFGTFPDLAKKAEAAAPAAAAPAAVAPVGDASKSAAAGGDLDLSPNMLIKLAKAVLATEEGVSFAQYTLEKAAGAEHASEMIKAARAASAAHDETLYSKQAAFNEGMSKAASIHAELTTMVTEDEAGEILKQASEHCANMDAYDHPMLKAAYATGMEDAAMMEQGAEAGAAEPEIPMGGEALTMEDVVALLQEMIANGEITEEEVAAGLASLEGGGEAAAMPGAEAAAPPAEAAAPPEAAPEAAVA